jgi:8-oxo-dGTP pyrophosphatase MutT (NUDIX family)
MGERIGTSVFLPEHYVFPGGRVEADDAEVTPAQPLRAEVAARLAKSCTPRRAKALALAAVRETFEETGLILGQPLNGAKPSAVPAGWTDFFATGLAPALDRLTYVARAITPAGRPRRFHARFFVAEAAEASGQLKDSQELLKLSWFPIAEVRALNVRPITLMALDEIQARLEAGNLHDPARPIPAIRTLRGKRQLSYD